MTEPSIRWRVLAMVMSGVFLSTMDSGMINVALPTIMRSFDLSLEHAEFIVSLYLLTITVTLVFWGKLGDRLGRANVYLGGMAVFSLGAVACYGSSTFHTLLLSRFAQALGASMMMASGPAIIKMVFPAAYLGRSLGMVGVATACGLLTGPFVSGLILASFSWQAIFLVTLPVSGAVLLAGWIYLLDRIPTNNSAVVAFDWQGSSCWVIMAVLCVWIFHRVDILLAPSNIALFIFLVVLIFLFIRLERKSQNPIVPVSLFRNRYYWVAVFTAVISFAALFSVLVLVPFFLEYILDLPIEEVGKVMMAVPATLIVLSPASGRLYDKIGARFLTTTGMGISTFALASLAYLSPESSTVEVMGKLALLGAGQSIFLSPNSASILSRVDEEHSGVTAGILATARNFGMVTGATLAAALFAWWFSYFSGGSLISEYTMADEGFFILAWRTTLLMTASLALLGGIISVQRQ
ncbi:MAG: MDR-type permease [uncultured bacterium]|nr:MAG: MDR-type permease [uncultured bacterium]